MPKSKSGINQRIHTGSKIFISITTFSESEREWKLRLGNIRIKTKTCIGHNSFVGQFDTVSSVLYQAMFGRYVTFAVHTTPLPYHSLAVCHHNQLRQCVPLSLTTEMPSVSVVSLHEHFLLLSYHELHQSFNRLCLRSLITSCGIVSY